jgi:hypothetical protein
VRERRRDVDRHAERAGVETERGEELDGRLLVLDP